MSSMLCLDCELAANGLGCSGPGAGICGRSAEVAAFQNLLLDFARKLALQMVERSCSSERFDRQIVAALTASAGGINFDGEELRRLCAETAASCGVHFPDNRFDQLEIACRSGIASGRQRLGCEMAARLQLLFTGIRGIALCYDRVLRLGRREEAVSSYLRRALAYSLHPDLKPREMLKLLLDCGLAARSAMELLEREQAARFGEPTPAEVRSTPRKGRAILVTGHDLGVLADLLQALAGTGIDLYTHGELLAAHSYPVLRGNSHLAGHLGGAWHEQQREFARFPGPVLAAGNCVMPPLPDYASRFFTGGAAYIAGVRHLAGGGYAPLVEAASALPGFAEELPAGEPFRTGFGRMTLERIAGKLAGLLRSGQVRRLFLIAGCDGALSGNQYAETLARMVPEESIVLTLGCAKYRLRGLISGEIDGVPRLIDVGQCTDFVAVPALLETLGCALDLPMEQVPLSIYFAWHGQTSVAILLALLAAGFRDIRFGPVPPAFLTPAMREIMERLFALRPAVTPQTDFPEAFRKKTER